MAASDLVLLPMVKAWVPIKNSNTVDDALLASLITACSNDFMRATKRPDLLYATYTETRIGDGSSRMTLRHWPIQAVSSLQIFTPPATAATAVNQSEDQIEPGYYWDEDLDPELCWTLYLTPSTVPSRFSDEGQVVINYSAGYVGPNDDVDTG